MQKTLQTRPTVDGETGRGEDAARVTRGTVTNFWRFATLQMTLKQSFLKVTRRPNDTQKSEAVGSRLKQGPDRVSSWGTRSVTQ